MKAIEGAVRHARRQRRVWHSLSTLCKEARPGISATSGWFPAQLIAQRCQLSIISVQQDLRAMVNDLNGVEFKQVRHRHLWRIVEGTPP